MFRDAGLDTELCECIYAIESDASYNPLALDALAAEPDATLMVGDRAQPDGAAVEQGITTLLLPPLTRAEHSRLHRVTALCVP